MSYTYDAEGKLTQRSEGTDSDAFTYGWGGMLKQIQKTRASTVTQTLSYAYDGAGQRVKVTDSGGTRYFLYDGGMPLLELNATQNITASYLYGADGVVYRKKHTSPPSYEYHLKNALGSTIIETNNSKTVLARYEYDVFGAVRSETGTSDNVRKFTGKEYDADVRLYYYAARYYDPYIGRFTQRDPIGDGINWYAYAYNNPMRFADPTGQVPADIILDVVGIGSGVYQLVRAPSVKNAMWLAADIGLTLVPYVPSPSGARVGMRLIDNVSNIDKATDVGKGLKTLKKAPPHKVVNALKGFKARRFQFRYNTFHLDKKGLKHILTRHHPSYWDGSINPTNQTFFDPSLTIDDITNIISDVLKQNRETLVEEGGKKIFQVRGTVNGTQYVVGVNRGRIAQLYPELPTPK